MNKEFEESRKFMAEYVKVNGHKLAKMNGETFAQKIQKIHQSKMDRGNVESIDGKDYLVIKSKIK